MKHYSLLSDLFTYPKNEDFKKSLELINSLIASNYPECISKLNEINFHFNSHNLNEQQEYYIKTFDVQALCYLDIGYVLFGEDYKRGEFLVNMYNEHKLANNDCGKELADHLPNILKLLPKIENKNLAEELAYSLLIPALREILKNFKEEKNIYKTAFELLLYILESDFKNLNYDQFKILNNDKTNFLENINCTSCKTSIENKKY